MVVAAWAGARRLSSLPSGDDARMRRCADGVQQVWRASAATRAPQVATLSAPRRAVHLFAGTRRLDRPSDETTETFVQQNTRSIPVRVSGRRRILSFSLACNLSSDVSIVFSVCALFRVHTRWAHFLCVVFFFSSVALVIIDACRLCFRNGGDSTATLFWVKVIGRQASARRNRLENMSNESRRAEYNRQRFATKNRNSAMKSRRYRYYLHCFYICFVRLGILSALADQLENANLITILTNYFTLIIIIKCILFPTMI